jgi:DNA repair protein RadD
MQLRPYQLAAVESLRGQIREGKRRPVLVAPTGSGKTVIGSHMITLAADKGRRALFIAHRKELIDQTSRKLRAFGVEHGIIMAGYKPRPEMSVQIASIQTLVRRELPPADLLLIDESHHATSATYRKVIDAYPDAITIGLTATAFRADGSGLGDVFDSHVQVATVQELTDSGFLVPARYWSHPSRPDMAGVATKRGEFDAAETEARCDKAKLIGDLVEHYRQIAQGRRAIVFAVSVKHSEHIRDAFLQVGIPAAHIDGETPRDEREQVLAGLASGDIWVVTNCGILSEGFDCPAAEVLISARPTASLGLWLQMVGRVLRPMPGKTTAMVIDHAGNVVRHGFATDDHPVDLGSGLKARKKSDATPVKTCPKCYAVLPATTVECPSCAASLVKVRPEIRQQSGDLREMRAEVCPACGGETQKRPDPTHGTGIWCVACGKLVRWMAGHVTPGDYYRKQLDVCRANGWKTGRAAVLFKNRYGRWPKKEEQQGGEDEQQRAA